MPDNSALNHLLGHKDSPLAFMARKAQEIQKLSQYIKQALPESQRDKVNVANVENGIVILFAANHSLANQLRYQQSQLLTHLRQHEKYSGLAGIKIELALTPPNESAKIPRTQRSQTSNETIIQIRETASTTSHPGLKAQLLALAASMEKAKG